MLHESSEYFALNKAGYFGVSRSFYQYDRPKPHRARVYRGGSFATAKEAALCGARSREGEEEQGQEQQEEEQEKEQEESFHFAGSKSFI